MNQRLQRLADQIQRELAVLIRDEVNDPRLTGFVTISSVKISSDLGYVFMSPSWKKPWMMPCLRTTILKVCKF